MPNPFIVGFIAGAVLSSSVWIPTGALIVTAHADPPAACQFPDGNPDGSACTWTNPTGEQFQVQAHTYGTPACRDICLGA